MNARITRRGLEARFALGLGALLWLAACSGEAARDEVGPAADSAVVANAPSSAAPAALPLRRPRGMETRLLPPGAVIGADPNAEADAITFQAREDPARLLDWFRATGNGADFVLESEMQEGAEYVFSGRARASGEGYSVRIAPQAGGGTTGTIVLAPR